MLSIVLRLLTEDFKEDTLKMNLPNIEYQSHILPNNNPNYLHAVQSYDINVCILS